MIDPDAPIGLFTRLWDWLTYQPWIDDEIAEQVAKSVAYTCYKKWHTENRYVELPMDQFTPLTPEEIANGDIDYLYQEHLEFEAIRAELVQAPAMRTLHIRRSDYYKDFAESIHRPLTEADHAELDPINVLTADWTPDVCHLTGDDGFCAECGKVVEDSHDKTAAIDSR